MKNFRETDIFRRIAVVIITLSSVLFLFGCNDTGESLEEGDDPNPGAIQVIDINGDIHETTVSVIEEEGSGEPEEASPSTLPERNLAQVAQNLSVSNDSNYAYSGLDETGKNCYLEIYAILSEMLENVELSSKDPDEVDLAFRAVMVDHPELFYVKGYSIGKYMNGKMLRKIVFSGSYTMTEDEVERARDQVEAYVDEVIAGCPEDADDFDTIKYVHDYLIKHNEYDTDSVNNQNILSVVQNGRTVCQGYTKMMQLILNRMGVFCTLVNGKACGSNGVPDSSEELADAKNAEWGGHVWNIVKCNGMYYNVDVTWGDAVINLMSDDGSLSRDIEVNYEFFLVDDATLDETHDPEPVVPMPRCISMEDNYYRHEGLYFTDVDPEGLRRAIENAYASGEDYLFLKASSPEVYEKIKQHLFDDQNVFNYVGRTNVRYVEFAERNLIMISL